VERPKVATKQLKVSKDTLSVIDKAEEKKKRGNINLTQLLLGRPSRASGGAEEGKEAPGAGVAPPKKKGALKLRDSNSFQTYIYRVVKEVMPELTISKKSMALLNDIMVELFDKIMKESRELMVYSKKHTLTSKEIETAVRLLFPGELQKLAVNTSRAAMQRFKENNA
jgi:histone H2B